MIKNQACHECETVYDTSSANECPECGASRFDAPRSPRQVQPATDLESPATDTSSVASPRSIKATMKNDDRSDLYLSQIARATMANMHYTRVLALVVMFLIFQAFIVFLTWGAFLLADDFSISTNTIGR